MVRYESAEPDVDAYLLKEISTVDRMKPRSNQGWGVSQIVQPARRNQHFWVVDDVRSKRRTSRDTFDMPQPTRQRMEVVACEFRRPANEILRHGYKVSAALRLVGLSGGGCGVQPPISGGLIGTQTERLRMPLPL